jgi:hypothetical protein
MSDGWTLFSEEKERAIYIGDDGALQVSFDGMQTWETIGKLTNPVSGAQMLMDMLGVQRCQPTH